MIEQQQGVPGKNGGRLSMAGMGRARGVPNKLTRTVKAMVMAALDKAGGEEFFVKLATSRHQAERIAFATLCGRVIPQEVHGALDTALTVIVVKQSGETVRRELPCIAGKSERVLGNQPGNEVASGAE